MVAIGVVTFLLVGWFQYPAHKGKTDKKMAIGDWAIYIRATDGNEMSNGKCQLNVYGVQLDSIAPSLVNGVICQWHKCY